MEKKDAQIIQQNRILLGGQTINLRARQLVYVLAASMDKDNPTGEIVIEADKFLQYMNNAPGEKWSDAYALTNYIFDHLNKNPILIKEQRKKDFVKINWLSSLGITNGILRARFSADIADYFQYRRDLPYTKLLWDLRPYNSSFTARIMDLFQRFHNKPSGISEFDFEYDVDELKLFFGVHDKYPRFFDFEKRVLKTAEKELEENNHVPYWFEYSKIKRGRKVEKIAFNVYVRPKILLDMAPELRIGNKNDKNQINIFELKESKEFSNNKIRVLEKLESTKVPDRVARKLVSNLADTQAIGFWFLVEYGVNHTLAYSLMKEHCASGELLGREHDYIKFVLHKIETDRLKRIEEAKSSTSKKRTTPDDKKGGLPKKVLVEQQHFPAFMELLSKQRKQADYTPKSKRGGDFNPIANVIKKMVQDK